MDTGGQTEAPIATDDTREMMAEEEDGLISRASLSAHSKKQCPPCDAAFLFPQFLQKIICLFYNLI